MKPPRLGAHLFFLLPVIVCLVLLTNCGRAAGGLEEGLYLRTIYSFGSLNISTLFIGPGDRIIMDPDGGVDPFDMTKISPKNVGTYKFNGKDKVDVQWGGGRGAETLGVEFEKGKLSAFDGGLVSKASTYGKNQTLEGTYSGSLSAGGGSVAAVREITFTKDGKFSMGTLGTISAGVTTGSSSSAQQGTYSLSGNTLTLKFSDGKTEKHTVMPYSTAAEGTTPKMSDERLIYEHMALKRVK